MDAGDFSDVPALGFGGLILGILCLPFFLLYSCYYNTLSYDEKLAKCATRAEKVNIEYKLSTDGQCLFKLDDGNYVAAYRFESTGVVMGDK